MFVFVRPLLLLLSLLVATNVLGIPRPHETPTQQDEVYQVIADLEEQFGDPRVAALAVLSEMTETEWQVFEFLISADAPALDKFYRDFDGVENIYILPDGSFSPVEPQQPAEGQLIKVASTKFLITRIRDIVATINGRALNIQNRLPTNTPSVRDLFEEIPSGRLREMISLVTDELGPILDFVRAQRDGFEDFRDFRMANFIADINVMLDNLLTLWNVPQELICLRRPEYQPLPLNLSRLRDLVERAPPLLLYGMETALQDIDFDWQLGQLTSELDIEPICESGTIRISGGFSLQASGDSTTRQRYRMRRCQIFTSGEGFFARPAEEAVSRVEKFVAFLDLKADILDQFERKVPDDKCAAIGAVAVGGGTGGTCFKNPMKVVTVSAAFIVGRIKGLLEDALKIRKECEDNDATWEGDLLSCSAKVAYILPNNRREFGEQAYLDDLVERRIAEVRDAGLGVNRADDALEESRSRTDTRESFVCLCDAYQRLVLPGSSIPVVDCVESPQ